LIQLLNDFAFAVSKIIKEIAYETEITSVDSITKSLVVLENQNI